MTHEIKPARDWKRLLREGINEGVQPLGLGDYIADNTDDPRTTNGFPAGYHQMIATWLLANGAIIGEQLKPEMEPDTYTGQFQKAMNYMCEDYTGGSVVGLKYVNRAMSMVEINPETFSVEDANDFQLILVDAGNSDGDKCKWVFLPLTKGVTFTSETDAFQCDANASKPSI